MIDLPEEPGILLHKIGCLLYGHAHPRTYNLDEFTTILKTAHSAIRWNGFWITYSI